MAKQSDSVNRADRSKNIEDLTESKYDPAFPHDASFPPNVYPSEENRRKWSDQVDADRTAREKGKEPKVGVRMGGGVVDDGE